MLRHIVTPCGHSSSQYDLHSLTKGSALAN
ncbi:MAG: hypothetical protein ACI97H_000001 [Marinobacter psychrophilus]